MREKCSRVKLEPSAPCCPRICYYVISEVLLRKPSGIYPLPQPSEEEAGSSSSEGETLWGAQKVQSGARPPPHHPHSPNSLLPQSS